MPKTKPFIIGHRGASKYHPENTLPAFRAAFEDYQADMVEFDIKESRDGIPVVFHDDTLERTTNGHGMLSDFTLEELRGLDAGYFFDPENNGTFPARGKGIHIPTLEEIFSHFPERSFAIEIKDPSRPLLDSVMKLVKAFQARNRCIVGSTHDVIFRAMRKDYPDFRGFLSRRRVLWNLFRFTFFPGFRKKYPGFVASIPPVTKLFAFKRSDWIQFLHKEEISVFFWTVNTPEEMKELRENGADGIISDDPKLLREILTAT